MSELGQRIALERERLGVTRAALARLVGVSDVSVHYWERGVIKQIGHNNLLALARVFGLTVSELLDDPMLGDKPDALTEYARRLVAFGDDPRGGGMRGDPLWEDLKAEAPSSGIVVELIRKSQEGR